MTKKILVALGGNALIQSGQLGSFQEQMDNIHACCKSLIELVENGHKLLVTHGNGPQVGNLLIQNEMASKNIPVQPLHACVAQTQGQMAYMIQTELDSILAQKTLKFQTAAILTRILVDKKDPAFTNPTKPIGPFFDEHYAKKKIILGEKYINDSNRGWRRVVPSPKPLEVIELEAIKEAFMRCAITVAVGGGGIPVVRNGDSLTGVDAVIDKDLASSLLARLLDVDKFIILTDVANVKLNYKTAHEKRLTKLSVQDCKKHLVAGEFGIGSMEPKVQAALEFVQATKKTAIITSLTKLIAALEGKAGTQITI